MEFGFLIDKRSFEFDCFKIAPKDNFEDILHNFYENAEVSNGWFYGRKVNLQKNFQEKRDFMSDAPTIHSSFFEVTPTHTINWSKNCTEEHIRFLILGYGFLQGLYLISEGWSHLGRTAYRPGLLNGLYLSHNDYHNGMKQINSFYLESSAEVRKNMFACIHWFLLGQSYEYEWDRFDAQYKVLDGIFNVSRTMCPQDPKKRYTHSERPEYLAKYYSIDLPNWAKSESDGRSKLTKLRNALTHEAIYAGQPIGLNYPEENYTLEFRAFNVKLISACLGLKTPYLNVPVDCRLAQLWNFD